MSPRTGSTVMMVGDEVVLIGWIFETLYASLNLVGKELSTGALKAPHQNTCPNTSAIG
jgi:hypothetical protein